MNSQISTKLAALVIALLMNGAMIGGIGYVFNSQIKSADSALVAQATRETTAFC
jgi:hypothetical protein